MSSPSSGVLGDDSPSRAIKLSTRLKTVGTIRLYVLREMSSYAVTLGSMVRSEIRKQLPVDLNPETKDEVRVCCINKNITAMFFKQLHCVSTCKENN